MCQKRVSRCARRGRLLIADQALEHRLPTLDAQRPSQVQHRDPTLGRVPPVGRRRVLLLELLNLVEQILQLVLVHVQLLGTSQGQQISSARDLKDSVRLSRDLKLTAHTSHGISG